MANGIIVFDGSNTIGGNKIYLNFDGNGIFFDFGLNYNTLGNFFEEFLKPRRSRGIHDFLMMNLIPKINNYRKDLIPSDINLSKFPKLKIDIVLLSHAHMDHIGYAGMLDFNIPFMATPMTVAIMKAMTDCASSLGIEYETTYGAQRVLCDDDSRILETTNYRNSPYEGRSIFTTTNYQDNFRDFWASCPSTRDLKAGELKNEMRLNFEYKCFEVDHSIYGAAAYAVNTSSGWVVYTGDLRIHGKFKEKTEKFVKEAESLEPMVLITEGTRIGKGESSEESESTVYEKCLEAASSAKNLIIADFSPRNFERLDSFMEIARKTNRKLVVLAKDAYLLDSIKYVKGKDRIKELLIYKHLKSNPRGFEKKIREDFINKLIDPIEIAKNSERYILAFSFWDMNNLLDIKPNGGLYIYSSSEAYSEEQVIDFQRLWNWLKLFEIDIKGFSLKEENGKNVPEFESEYHASGHISQNELFNLIRKINPRIIIPVHTEASKEFEKLKEFKIIFPQNNLKIPLP